jgi:hypothetical protein
MKELRSKFQRTSDLAILLFLLVELVLVDIYHNIIRQKNIIKNLKSVISNFNVTFITN